MPELQPTGRPGVLTRPRVCTHVRVQSVRGTPPHMVPAWGRVVGVSTPTPPTGPTREARDRAAHRRLSILDLIAHTLATREVSPTITEIAALTGTDRRMVRKDLDVLTDAGLLRHVMNGTGTRRADRGIRLTDAGRAQLAALTHTPEVPRG